MARFLKVEAGHDSHDRTTKTTLKPRWINIYGIDEICAAGQRFDLDENGKKKRNADDTDFIYIEQTALKVVHTEYRHSGSDAELYHAEYYVDGAPEDWAATIEAALAADRFPPPPPEQIILTDRGEWTSGETYVPYDLTTDPDNSSRRYLCLKENKSTSSGVLANTAYWCDVSALA